MNKKLTFSGGEPDLNFDDILRDPVANRAALFAIIKGLSGDNNVLISGADVTVTAGVNAVITSGYVYLDGEILQVDFQIVTETQGTDLWELQKQVTYDSGGDKTFNDATPRQTWQKNRAVLVNVSSITGQDATALKPIYYDSGELAFTNLDSNITAGLNHLRQKGFTVSGFLRFTVNTTAGNTLAELPAGIAPPLSDVNVIIIQDSGSGASTLVCRPGTITTGGDLTTTGATLTVGETFMIAVNYQS